MRLLSPDDLEYPSPKRCISSRIETEEVDFGLVEPEPRELRSCEALSDEGPEDEDAADEELAEEKELAREGEAEPVPERLEEGEASEGLFKACLKRNMGSLVCERERDEEEAYPGASTPTEVAPRRVEPEVRKSDRDWRVLVLEWLVE